MVLHWNFATCLVSRSASLSKLVLALVGIAVVSQASAQRALWWLLTLRQRRGAVR